MPLIETKGAASAQGLVCLQSRRQGGVDGTVGIFALGCVSGTWPI
jgi:hypothetical protein